MVDIDTASFERVVRDAPIGFAAAAGLMTGTVERDDIREQVQAWEWLLNTVRGMKGSEMLAAYVAPRVYKTATALTGLGLRQCRRCFAPYLSGSFGFHLPSL